MLSPSQNRLSRISVSSYEPVDKSIIIPEKNNWTSQIYKTKPAYVATKITAKDVFEETKHATTLVLSQINEEKNNETEDLDAFVSFNETIESRRSKEKQLQNLFKKENLVSSKYKEHQKGPNFNRDGQIIKHSIIGSSENFERYQRSLKRLTIRESVILSAQELPNFERGATRILKQSGTILERNLSPNSQLTQSGLQSKKQGAFERKKEVKEVKMAKEDLYSKLDDLRKSQKKFYQEDLSKLRNLPLGDKLHHTKQSRCLEKYENTINSWNTTISSIGQRIKRPANKSVMMRADDFRRKVEEAEIFDLAQTGAERLGSSYWSASLRNPEIDANPVSRGHMRFKSSEDLRPLTTTIETIRRPFTNTKSIINFPTIGETRTIDRTKMEYITEKNSIMAKDLRKIRPHVITNIDDLMVIKDFTHHYSHCPNRLKEGTNWNKK